jgi:CO/xanthine dehydrogenase Mo-binding subunit
MTAAPRFSGMVDARQRVTGNVGYTIDKTLPGMLHAKVLRSTAAHARIRRVDVSRALNVPGIAVVLTGRDLLERPDIEPFFGAVYRDQPILATDKVRFVGDPVAAVAAHDIDAAREAISLIDVEYEELPAVFDLDAALADGAVILHEQPQQAPGVRQRPGTNICGTFRLRKGDIDAGFGEADEIFEDTFTSPPLQHVPLETHACVAQVANGKVTVWSGTQMPYNARRILADIFKVPQGRVRVIVGTIGGGYGGKGQVAIEPLTSALSLVARRPVKLHLTREEEFVTITKHGARIQLRTGLKKDGTIVARQSVCQFNTGAYANIGPRFVRNGGVGTGGPHRIPHIAIDSQVVYTNLPPAGAFRGYGINQAAWAYETQMDMIAERMGIDPLELRMKNLLEDGDTVMTGEPMEDAHFKELLGAAASWIGWRPDEPVERNGTRVRAKGLSTIIKGTVTPSTSTAVAKLGEDGSLDILTSSVEMGQGLLSALAILGGEPLGLSVDRVQVSTVDTDVTPYDQQTTSSRGTYAMGTAVQRAVTEVRVKVLELASDLLEASVDDLEVIEGKVVVKGVPERSLGLGEIVRKTRSGNILGEATYRTDGELNPETGQGIGSVHWHQGVGAAEVEVDTETGKVTVLRYHAGVYAGRIVNPVMAELQQEGNVAFGVGQALFEEMHFDSGQLQNGSLADYMISSIKDQPRDLNVDILENLPAGVIHGLGESTLPPVMPAIGNAVARATGVRILDLPITPEKVLRGLRELEARRTGVGEGAS